MISSSPRLDRADAELWGECNPDFCLLSAKEPNSADDSIIRLADANHWQSRDLRPYSQNKSEVGHNEALVFCVRFGVTASASRIGGTT
eukprot:CAMPEP_0183478820 /NCGR_PEP_ID=MMETSP0370-20130417/170582_1 /TAXON_ID=268820 /ORGANISM="Peridinium aciculiferum, Strain PAER-2" /LENGTH=87 /DNA_ID=CAMNT_0025671793 /DNA_START=291 /DNA_END=555 /DNA_ORIENTATION=+